MRRGFTLIEVMIAAAVIGLLASIALPRYQRYIVSVKQAEREHVFAEIERALLDEARRTGQPPAPLPANPPLGTLGQQKRSFVSDFRWGAVTGLPSAPVYHSYQVDRNTNREGGGQEDPVGTNNPTTNTPTNQGPGTTLPFTCFCLNAYGDLDGDGQWSLLRRCYCNGTVAGRDLEWEHLPALDRETDGVY